MAAQGANGGADQGAGERYVKFSRQSAQRIARVVRQVEGGDRNQSGLKFEHPVPVQNVRAFRIAKFSGSWNIGTIKVVTFSNAPTATANVTNLFWPITATSYVDEPCAVGKEGTAWYLIVPCVETAVGVVASSTATGVFAAQTSSAVYCSGTQTLTYVSSNGSPIDVITGVDIAASLNTSNCTITVSKTLTTTSVCLCGVTATVAIASQTATMMVAASTATAIFATSTATSTFLRIRSP